MFVTPIGLMLNGGGLPLAPLVGPLSVTIGIPALALIACVTLALLLAAHAVKRSTP